MGSKDIRWKQRFENFQTAFKNLKSAVNLAKSRPLSDLENQGLIQSFEFTHELAWNVLKDFLEFQGAGPLLGSKDTTRAAFQKKLLQAGEIWMEMIQSRNLTSPHTYNRKVAADLTSKIQNEYFQELIRFEKQLTELSANE